MGAQGTYQWRGFRDYLGADRSVGAVVDMQMSPDDWARLLGVGGGTEEFQGFDFDENDDLLIEDLQTDDELIFELLPDEEPKE